jgi:hypothetical protein
MPNSTLERLVYRSRAVTPAPTAALDGILAVSLRNNGRHRITGALGFTGRTYIQLLEGRSKAIDALMEQLRRDPRHTDLKVLRRGPAAGRLAPGWSMARIDLALLTVEVTALLESADGDGLAALLADLVARGETVVV